MQESSGSGIGTSGRSGWLISAGFRGSVDDGYSAWGCIRLWDGCGAARTLRSKSWLPCRLSPGATLGGSIL